MRHSLQNLALVFISLVISAEATAVAVEILAASHGASCAEAKANLRNVVVKGPNAYSLEQSQNRQFETAPAATNYCRAVRASAARVPEVTEAALFPIPLENVLAYHYPCSTTEVNGHVVFGVGFSSETNCY